jgi:O-antigen biosynthesis protein
VQGASSRLAAGLSPPGPATFPRPLHGAERLLFATKEPTPLRLDAAADVEHYRSWVARREAGRLAEPGRVAPGRVALLVVLDRPRGPWLRRCLRSVVTQTHPHWQLVLAPLGPLGPGAEEALAEELAGQRGDRMRRVRPEGPDAVSGVRAALDASDAPLVALLGQHDELAPDALTQLVAGLGQAVCCYGDEDQIDDVGAAAAPRLKPGWSPELLLSTPYLGRPLVVRRQALLDAGGVADQPDGDWEHDLMLRLTEGTSPESVVHVAEVLYRRRRSTEDSPPSGPGAVTAALARRHEGGSVEPGPVPDSWRVRRTPSTPVRVSAIVCFRDGAPFLRACADTVTATSGPIDLEFVLVDNGSVEPETQTLLSRLAERPDVTVLSDPRPFNWAGLNNAAVTRCRGDMLLFLNNDIEARRVGWLEAMVAQAERPAVAAVGARLLYPTGQLQHAGVVVGLGGAAGHVLCGLPADQPGYGAMAMVTRNCSAVTGAAMAMRRAVFEELDGFDESLGVDLNDVDLCLRAIAAGYRVVYEPQAELIHHESPSRGTSGSVEDIARFIDRWEPLLLSGDPLLNFNLTRVDCSCALRGPDELGWWQQWRSTLEGS